MKRKVRAELSTAEKLDDSLQKIQESGGDVHHIIPFNGSLKGQQHDTGDGRHDIGFAMETRFVITYSEIP